MIAFSNLMIIDRIESEHSNNTNNYEAIDLCCYAEFFSLFAFFHGLRLFGSYAYRRSSGPGSMIWERALRINESRSCVACREGDRREHRVNALKTFSVNFSVSLSLVPETHLNGLPDEMPFDKSEYCGDRLAEQPSRLSRWLKPQEDESCFHSSSDSWIYGEAAMMLRGTIRRYAARHIFSLSRSRCYIKGMSESVLHLRLSTVERVLIIMTLA